MAETTKKCPHCYSDIDVRASVCPHCGKNAKVKTGGYQFGTFLMALALVTVLIDLSLGTGFLLVGGIVLFLVGWVIRRNV